jgi:hypothetical protein
MGRLRNRHAAVDVALVAVCLSAAVGACQEESGVIGTSDGGASDADADADSDADADGDTDTFPDGWDDQDDDGDCIPNGVEGTSDADGDGVPNYQDDDSDDDGIADADEVGPDCGAPLDSDDDGRWDFIDGDSDNDGLGDGDEAAAGTDPTDPDSDDDGVSDLVEVIAGTDPLDGADNPEAHGNFVFLVPYEDDPAPPEGDLRFQTAISKVDLYFLEDISVSMAAELASIHDNIVEVLDELTCDPGETAASCPADCPAGCGDDSCDPGETVTSCPADCLGFCGDGACVGNETPVLCAADCPDDVCGGGYCCGDRVCDGLETPTTCPTDCAGTCGDGVCHAGEQAAFTGCIEDLWSGVGVFGTSSINKACGTDASCDSDQNGTFAYRNLLDLQASPAAAQDALPSQCWGSACWEPPLGALFYALTGYGSDSATAAGFTMPPLAVEEPPGCASGGWGTPCFREDTLPIVALIGDEQFNQCYLPDGASLGDCLDEISTAMGAPAFPIVAGAANDRGAKIVGIMGKMNDAKVPLVTADMSALCEETGSVDGAGDPFVFSGADTDAAQAIASGIETLTTTITLDMLPAAVDDPSDAVDAVVAFVDHLAVFTPGTAECVAWPDTADADADGTDDEFLGVTGGMPVCWKLVVKENLTVEPTDEVQVFEATVRLWGNGTTLLDTRAVYFVVPPDLSVPTPE